MVIDKEVTKREFFIFGESSLKISLNIHFFIWVFLYINSPPHEHSGTFSVYRIFSYRPLCNYETDSQWDLPTALKIVFNSFFHWCNVTDYFCCFKVLMRGLWFISNLHCKEDASTNCVSHRKTFIQKHSFFKINFRLQCVHLWFSPWTSVGAMA